MVVNRSGNTRTAGDNGDNHDHNHIEEVIYDNDAHLGVPVITGRLENSADRQ